MRAYTAGWRQLKGKRCPSNIVASTSFAGTITHLQETLGTTVIELVRTPPGSRALDLHVKGRFHIAGRRAQIDKYKRPLARQATTEGNVPESAKWMDESRAVRADFAYRHDPVQPRRAGEFSHRQQQRGAKSNRKQSCRSLVGLYMAEYEGSNK